MPNRTFLALLILLASTPHGGAQELTSIFPAGGQRGTKVEITLAGKNLQDAHTLLFARASISAQKTQANRFVVTMPADAPPGACDLWAVTPRGISNPRRFVIGQLPEINEKEANDEPRSAQAVAIPVVINGGFSGPVDRDHYRFELAKGRRISIHFRSETLDGTARPALTLFDAQGKELLHDDGRAFEPALEFESPADGAYVLKVEERGYQKGENHVYRLALFDGPRLVAAFPQLMSRGKTEAINLYGYRLPGGTPAGIDYPPHLEQIAVKIAAPQIGDADGGGWLPASAAFLDGFRYQLPRSEGAIRFGLTDLPVIQAADTPHAEPAQALAVPFPTAVAGRFLRPRQVDWYRLTAKPGQTLWLEAAGERAGTAMDLEIAVHDRAGKPLTLFSDVVIPKGDTSPVPLKSLDPMGTWKVAGNGDFLVVVRDLYGSTRWGVQRTYELQVDKRREEVRVVVVPGATGVAVPAGGSAEMTLALLRRGGHEGPVRVRAEGLPPGLEAPDLVIAAKQTLTKWKLSAKPGTNPWAGRLTLVAETTLDGKTQSVPVIGLTTVRAGAAPVLRRSDGIMAAVLAK